MTNPSLAMMLDFLETDPANRPLLVDTAMLALDAGRADLARDLLGRAAAIAPLSPQEDNLRGLAALGDGDAADAIATFQRLLEADAAETDIRYNLAWAHVRAGNEAAAVQVLTAAAAAASPRAATLRIHLLHRAGDLETAASDGARFLAHFPTDRDLNAALSVVAIDGEDPALAAACAARAGDHPDALTTLGTLSLRDENATGAQSLFERALAGRAHQPRAWVGLGLTHLLTGNTAAAPAAIDKGAEQFGDHLGSWIAAGWAHLIAGTPDLARARFEHALQLDPAFSEAQGSLAVLDLLAGKPDEARKRAAIALRLDRDCFSAALAHALLAGGANDAARSRRIVEAALSTPIDQDGRTIGQALARMGLTLD